MKIGILTFHRAHNYGAVLQCYALLQYLTEQGHSVEVIDYRQPFVEKIYKPINWKYFFKKMAKPHKFIKYLYEIRRNYLRNKIFSKFQIEFFKLTPPCDALNVPQDFDVYVIGSDQLWSKYTGSVDSVYCGKFAHSSKSRIYGYAISTTVSFLQSCGMSEVKNFASNFAQLSFRESAVSNFLKDNWGVESHVHIDPTLLVDRNHWQKLLNNHWKHKRYIAIYQVRGDYKTQNQLCYYAKQLAKSMNCELVDLSSYKLCYPVEDFVSCIESAECVITSSFHASVFALIFERKLYAYRLGDPTDERLTNLLSQLGADVCIQNIATPPCGQLSIDYRQVRENLKRMRSVSENYLNSFQFI